MKRKSINKIVYFDTNIYNKLLDDDNATKQIKDAVYSREIGIFITGENILELLRTHETDHQKAQRLFQLTWNICLKKPTQNTWLLINAEFRHLIDPSVRINIYSNNQTDKDNFMDWWKALSREPQSRHKEIIDKCDEIKRNNDYFGDRIRGLKDVTPKINKGDSFDMFCKEVFNTDSVKSWLEPYLQGVNNPQITIDIVLKNLSQMQGFSHSLYDNLAYYYRQNSACQNHDRRKTKPSDSGDLRHAIYVGYSDIFVSKDFELIKYLRYTPGNKHRYLNLEEFLQYLTTLRSD